MLTAAEKAELLRLIESGRPLPEAWRKKLFPAAGKTVEIGKEYRLEYEGKMKREQVLAETPAAPWQLVRRFNTERPHPDGWRNLLVWGDNLMALRELLVDQRGPNRFGTRGKIKLIYIDPPFATKQDFMKDKEKAYRDKVIGSQFIEFIRRRLILLRELLADDGSIYVHLDTKKGHYIKAVLDEVFGEENFQNEIIWKRTPFAGSSKARAAKFPINHDSVFFYSKGSTYKFSHQYEEYSDAYKSRFKYQDENGWYRKTSLKTYSTETEIRLKSEGKFIEPVRKGAYPSYKQYLHESKGKQIEDIWLDCNLDNPMSTLRVQLNYPTMKPEKLLERIILASSDVGDIVLDCFSGSGSTPATAEKLGRRWIAIDSGKLSVYTTQKRFFNLKAGIGSEEKDDRVETERIEDWLDHLKSAPGILLVTDKAKKGECDVTLELLADLAALVRKHDLAKGDNALSVVCPENKLLIGDDQFDEPDEGAGEKRITVEGVEFRISIIAPKDKPEKEQPLVAKEFALYRAGLYDMDGIKKMPWEEYRPFVMTLFNVRDHPHHRYGLSFDGYVGTNSAFVWNFPEHPKQTLDYGFVDSLHEAIRGRNGEKFYVIAPVVAMDFAEDEVTRGGATYVFLKVPLSVLLRLLQRTGEAKTPALKQPGKEADVNEVIDSVGFDFITQPLVDCRAVKREDGLLVEYAIEITDFRSQTLTTEPDDFANFETLSMAMVDLDYHGADAEDEKPVFSLSRCFWGEELLTAAGGVDKAQMLSIAIPEADFPGERMMVILCDRYGNEKKLVYAKTDFVPTGRVAKAAKKKGGRK